MRFIQATTCLMMATLTASCGKKNEAAPAPTPTSDPASKAEAKDSKAAPAKVPEPVKEVASKVASKVEEAKHATKEGKPISQEEYEQLIVALSACTVKDGAIDYECPAKKALDAAGNRMQTLSNLGGMNAALGRKLISHESPAVRIKAAELMASLFGSSGESQETIVEAAKVEKDANVLAALIGTVSNHGKRNPKVGEMFVEKARHAEADVRLKVVYALGSSWNAGMPRRIETLIELTRDREAKIRAAACQAGGQSGDDAFLPTLERGSADAKKDPDLYYGCMKGLVAMWAQYPFFETNSEKAYRLTLKRLGATPRSDTVPPWSAIGDLAYVNKDSEGANKWRARNTWFKHADVVAVLGPVIMDPNANSMARSSALESAIALGATKADLTRWRDSYSGKKSGAESLIAAIDKALPTAK